MYYRLKRKFFLSSQSLRQRNGRLHLIVFSIILLMTISSFHIIPRYLEDWTNVDAGNCVTTRSIFTSNSNLYCVPSAVMIGCQKCGSTALANLLLRHPQIKGRTGGNAFAVSRFKHDFWARTFRRQRVTWNDYVRQDAFLLNMNDRENGVITFEKSPDYMASEKAAIEIKELMPSVKLLAILRDPISRAYSAFMWQCNKGRVVIRGDEVLVETNTWNDIVSYVLPSSSFSSPVCTSELFDRYLKTAELKNYDKMDSIIGKGMYAIQLNQWMSHFNRDQFHVVLTEQLRAKRVQVLNDVLEFFGLSKWNDKDSSSSLSSTKANKGKYLDPISESAREILKSVYKDPNAKLEAMFPEVEFRTWWM